MQFLLDTNAFIRWSMADPRIPATWVETLVDPTNEVWLSAASAWEIAIKKRSGKLLFGESLLGVAEFHGFAWLGMSAGDAETAGALEWEHADPFDRMLVAQARLRGLTIVTFDEKIRAAPGVATL